MDTSRRQLPPAWQPTLLLEHWRTRSKLIQATVAPVSSEPAVDYGIMHRSRMANVYVAIIAEMTTGRTLFRQDKAKLAQQIAKLEEEQAKLDQESVQLTKAGANLERKLASVEAKKSKLSEKQTQIKEEVAPCVRICCVICRKRESAVYPYHIEERMAFCKRCRCGDFISVIHTQVYPLPEQIMSSHIIHSDLIALSSHTPNNYPPVNT